jgi:YHS domain-containing protein
MGGFNQECGMRRFLLGLLMALAAAVAGCSTIHTRTVDGVSGVMLGGYDPVSYFEQPAPVMGSAALQARGHYGVYFFSSKANQEKFTRNPVDYEPQFGGHCADGVAYDLKTPGNPLIYEVANSKSRGKKLLIFGGLTAHKYWAAYRAQQWYRADRYWNDGLENKITWLHNAYRWTIGRVPHYLTTEQVNAALKDLGENPPPFCDCE